MNRSQSSNTKRKVTRLLSADTIDKRRQTQEFRREESMATHKHRLSLIMMYGVVCATPVLYVGWLLATWKYSPDQLTNVFSTGGGALGGFLISKINLFNGKDKKTS